ncbi:hypothetical protein [Colwellia ponticola]|uniref:Thiamin/hydroxymethyl pyrimidine-binding YkoF putative domain-containing protein n=1 Tax=Colwellia ponticola TaxID=2304625 RepID=A0A8H2JML4_9GAMM|nr:hypothetical protein [Colwellia ponticola]TMM45778.1 hypothetical protein FCS21_08145 [Colwellia ponticola]
MKISIELSLYPLAEEQYKTEIWAFIKRLRGVDGLQVVTNGMSTQVFGDYDLAVSHVMAEMKQVHQATDAAIFVCKFINGDRSQVEAES